MSADGTLLLPEVAQYLSETAPAEAEILQQIRTRTATDARAQMAAARATSATLVWLAKLINARHYLEIGTFRGYSSTALALALPEDGTVTTCDINLSHTAYAREAWQNAGVAHKVTLHTQPALITLAELLHQGKADFFDMALIDADKLPTAHYAEACYRLVRSGGIIAIDNVLLGGRISDEHCDSPSLSAMRQFNREIARDPRFDALTLPVGDGLTILCKK